MLMGVVISTMPVLSQETVIRVIDRMDIPGELAGLANQGGTIDFYETWTIHASKAEIDKTVDSLKISGLEEAAFWIMVSEHSRVGGKTRLGEVSYEFMLMDPESGQSNKLHTPTASLVSLHSETASIYRIPDQLLSVRFYETWIINPESESLEKRVHGIIPLIWQRRQTTDGEPINDGDTGLPVYFKIELERIPIRNP